MMNWCQSSTTETHLTGMYKGYLAVENLSIHWIEVKEFEQNFYLAII